MDLRDLYPIQALIAAELLRSRRLLVMLPRQEGKTEIGVRIMRAMLDTDRTRHCLLLAKSKKSAQKMAREKLMRLFESDAFIVNTEQVVNKRNKSAIAFIESVDKDPDRIRGGTYHYIHWSEVAFSRLEHGARITDIVNKVLMPTFRKTNGFLYLESTPNGENDWKDLWQNAKDILQAKTIRFSLSQLAEIGLVSRDEYDRIKSSTHPLIFRQEYECEFVSFQGLIYEEFSELQHVQDFSLPISSFCVYSAVDWGYVDATCALFAFVRDGKLYIFDEIYRQKQLLDQFADEFCTKIQNIPYALNCSVVADHEPDRIAELRRRGVPCYAANKTDALGQRIKIKELLWQSKIVIHPRCKMLIKDLKAIAWDTKHSSKREDADYSLCSWGHFDAEAALRYLVASVAELIDANQEHDNIEIALDRGVFA